MSDPRAQRVPPAAGLCGTCRHARAIANDRGSVFVLCGRSRADARYSRYPPLPVVSCAGFEASMSSGATPTDPA